MLMPYCANDEGLVIDLSQLVRSVGLRQNCYTSCIQYVLECVIMHVLLVVAFS